MRAAIGPLPSTLSPVEQVLPVHATEQDFTFSCRPLIGSLVRTFAVDVTVVSRTTEASGAVPLFCRFTIEVTESPGTKFEVLTGTATAGPLTSMSTVPEATVVVTGVVLSVKVPKVPMPATAAAAPITPSEPTTLRAVELLAMVLVLMFVVLPVSGSSTGDPGDRENSGGRTAGHPRAFRKECARDCRT